VRWHKRVKWDGSRGLKVLLLDQQYFKITVGEKPKRTVDRFNCKEDDCDILELAYACYEGERAIRSRRIYDLGAETLPSAPVSPLKQTTLHHDHPIACDNKTLGTHGRL
jgi:hypothetical protein